MPSAPPEEFTVSGGGAPSAVLLPGWATDGRVFGGLFPGLAAVRTSGALRIGGFADRLAAFLDREGRGPVDLLGWSLGGFLAAEFARRHPARVRRLVLVGIRRKYPAADVEAVRAALLRDRRACLSAFYTQCFFPSRMAECRAFRAGLQQAYLREMDEAALLSGLDFLAENAFPAASLPPVPVTVVHGEKDAVAPAAEAEEAARAIPGASFRLLRGAPHAAFLDGGFPFPSDG